MAATGNIIEDLEAIRDLVRPGTYSFDVYKRDGQVPWSPGVTQQTLEKARGRLPGFLEELAQIYRVTGNLVAGGLEFKGGLDEIRTYWRSESIDQIDMPMHFLESDDVYNATNTRSEGDDGWVPNGDLLVLGGGLYLSIGGPHLGAVYAGSFMGSQRAAYGLSDVVACTRDLYENGWYAYFDNSGLKEKESGFEDRVTELVMPVVERWHCSPRIARLMRHTEPPRPPGL